eukprot:6183003-Pleurochrysis_carterae.AAC.2
MNCALACASRIAQMTHFAHGDCLERYSLVGTKSGAHRSIERVLTIVVTCKVSQLRIQKHANEKEQVGSNGLAPHIRILRESNVQAA